MAKKNIKKCMISCIVPFFLLNASMTLHHTLALVVIDLPPRDRVPYSYKIIDLMNTLENHGNLKLPFLIIYIYILKSHMVKHYKHVLIDVLSNQINKDTQKKKSNDLGNRVQINHL